MTTPAVAYPTTELPGPGRPRPREFDWPQIAATAPVLAATLQRYLEQLSLSAASCQCCFR
jgi:hypothetical protein